MALSATDPLAPAALAGDPVALAAALIRCPSVTPDDGGALDVLQGALEALGFRCTRLPFAAPGTARIDNLYARLGSEPPHLCFAGHTDVVPVGDRAAWSVDPFAAEIRDGKLFGRGAADMKGAIACLIAAAARRLAASGGALPGSLSLLITGDEEGAAVNGTRRVLDWLAARNERIDHCLVGEPTSVRALGDTVKIGRRGSVTGRLSVFGAQGHVAYPHLADNPIPRLIEMLQRLNAAELDRGTEHFQPSHLEITSIDVGNPAANVIPARASAVFNIRHNDLHSAESLEAWLRATCDAVTAARGGAYQLAIERNGDAFLTPPGPWSDLVAAAIAEVSGRWPELSTGGGTSDARFIKDHCPVVEFGLVGQTMHKVDEQVALADLADLTAIYEAVLARYFSSPPA